MHCDSASRTFFKIGHVGDVTARLAAVNQHVPVEVLNEQWSIYLTQPWKTSVGAYEMEQRSNLAH
jgi:chorismate-pyruvate lyase